jgi:hypothetical protein
MTEKRVSPRTRALKSGRITFNHGSSSIDCTIRNLSASGAKLLVENALGLPDEFLLMCADDRNYKCTVRWRKLNEMGVSFDAAT